MPNTREKLIKLMKDTNTELERRHYMAVSIADHIIASGFIEELQNEGYDVGVDSALHNHFGLSWEDAAGLRKEIQRLQDAARWIPVTERLPNYFEYVLINAPGDKPFTTVHKAHLRKDGLWDTGLFRYEKEDVTHWMPLPQPPKGE